MICNTRTLWKLESESGSMILMNTCDNWDHPGKLGCMIAITLIIMYHRVREWHGGLCRPVETARSPVVTSVRSATGEAERDNAKDTGLSAKHGYWRGTRSSAMDKQCIHLSTDFLFCSMKWFTFNHSGIPVLSFLPKAPPCKQLTVWIGGTV